MKLRNGIDFCRKSPWTTVFPVLGVAVAGMALEGVQRINERNAEMMRQGLFEETAVTQVEKEVIDGVGSVLMDRVPYPNDEILETDSGSAGADEKIVLGSASEDSEQSFEITPDLLDTISTSRKGREILRAQHFSNGIFIPPTETFHKESKLHHYFRSSVHVNGRAAVYRDGYVGKRYYFRDGKAEVVFLRVGDEVTSEEGESLVLSSEADEKRRMELIGADAKTLEKMYGFFSKRSLVHYLWVFGGERDTIFYQRILRMHKKGQYRGRTDQNELLFRYLSGMELEKLEKLLNGVTPQEKMVRSLIEKYFPEKSWEEAMQVAKAEGMFMPFSIQPRSENEGGGMDIGLFQINTKWNAPLLIALGYTPKDLLDPKINVSVAAEIYKKHGWGKWHAAVKLGIVHEG